VISVIPVAERQAAAIFDLGPVAGYPATGAPTFKTVAAESLQTENLLALCHADEHDYKMARRAEQESEYRQDAAYTAGTVRCSKQER
jgi:hypothetical protein